MGEDQQQQQPAPPPPQDPQGSWESDPPAAPPALAGQPTLPAPGMSTTTNKRKRSAAASQEDEPSHDEVERGTKRSAGEMQHEMQHQVHGEAHNAPGNADTDASKVSVGASTSVPSSGSEAVQLSIQVHHESGNGAETVRATQDAQPKPADPPEPPHPPAETSSAGGHQENGPATTHEPQLRRGSRKRGSLELAPKPNVEAKDAPELPHKEQLPPGPVLPRGEEKDIAAQLSAAAATAAESSSVQTRDPPKAPQRQQGMLSHVAIALILLGLVMVSRLRFLPDSLPTIPIRFASPAHKSNERAASVLRSGELLASNSKRVVADISGALDELISTEEESLLELEQALHRVSEEIDRLRDVEVSSDRLARAVQGVERNLPQAEAHSEEVRGIGREMEERLRDAEAESSRLAETAADTLRQVEEAAELNRQSAEVSEAVHEMSVPVSSDASGGDSLLEGVASLDRTEAELKDVFPPSDTESAEEEPLNEPEVSDERPLPHSDDVSAETESSPNDTDDSFPHHASNPLKTASGLFGEHLEKGSSALEETLHALEDMETASLVSEETSADEFPELSTEDILKERMVERLEELREELESNLTSIAVDYAVSVRGGKVIARDNSLSSRSRLTSPSYLSSLNPIQLVKHIVGPLKMQIDPSVVISHSMPVFGPNRAFLRQCYCFKGSEGSITVGFKKPVALEMLQVFHLALAEATSAYKGSAPKHFSARGYLSDGGVVELGKFMYSNAPGFEELQSFPVSLPRGGLVKAVTFSFSSNGGAPLTCIYRLRAIGRISSSEDEI